MKTEEEVKKALSECKAYQIAGEGNQSVSCPLWPDEDSPGCYDCTAHLAWVWVLEGDSSSY